MGTLDQIEQLPRPAALAAGFALVAIVGLLDVVTGSELAFSTIYLLPIFLLTWSMGRWPGLIGAAASTAFRTWADLSGHTYTHPMYLYWNIGMRFALFVVMAMLLAELRRLFDQQRALAAVDHVTGAANRRTFIDAVRLERERARRYGHPYAIAYVDLDNFKKVNDTLGHAAGDTVLRTVATAIKGHVRHIDSLGRIGGDEFGLLLPETDEARAVTAVTKMRAGLLESLSADGWDVTVSIGVFAVSDSAMEVDAALAAADELMYAAKLAGKNGIRSASGSSTGGDSDAARLTSARTASSAGRGKRGPARS